MNTGSKLAAYALTLGVALGGGALAGNVVGPIAAVDEETEDTHGDEPHGPEAGTSDAPPAATTTDGTEHEDMPAGPSPCTFPPGDGATTGAGAGHDDPGGHG